MDQFGYFLTELGFKVIPYSFALYFPIRLLEFIWKRGYTRLVKAIWYTALGVTYLTDKVGIDALVMYICFIEAWDLLFQQIELNRDRKSKDSIKNLETGE